MKSGRISTLLLLLVVVIGGAAIAVIGYRSRERAAAAALEARALFDEARKSAAQRSVEVSEEPGISSELTVRAAAPILTRRGEHDAKQLEVLVLDPANSPVAGSKLMLFRADEVLADGATDGNGLAHFAPREGSGEYVLAAAGWEPMCGELELSAGRRTVTLAEGAVVAGTVLVDGLAPGQPLELSWSSDDRKRGVYALQPAFAKKLRLAHADLFVTAARTSADGTFTFRGLASDGAGSIRWKGAYFAEVHASGFKGPSFLVPTPRRDLVMRLAAGLELRLRVVDTQGAAVPGAAVALEYESSTMTTNADSEGRFVHSFSRDSFEKLGIRVAGNQGGGAKSYAFVPPPGLRGVWDLGDLAIGATRTLSVLVQDTEGQPVVDATVTPWPVHGAPSKERTDAAGRTTISIGAEDDEIAAGAFGYTSARTAVPLEASEVTATLSRACLLEFEIPGFTGDAQLVALELQGPTPMFAGEADLNSLTRKSSGEGANSSIGEKSTRFEPTADKSGRWRIAGLTPNQALRAMLKGGGKTLSEVEVAPLAPGERRRIELRLDEVGKFLRVRVRSPEADALSDATVYVSAASENTSSYRGIKVDAQGEVKLESLFGDRCLLFVRAQGFAVKSITLQPIPTGTIDITLELPRSVEVELVRRDGSLFLESAKVTRVGGGPFGGSMAASSGPGRYRVTGLSTSEALLSISGSFGRLSQLLDPSVPFVRIVVGEPGSIQVAVRITEERSRSGWSVAIALPGQTRDLTRDDLNFSDEGAAKKKFEGLAPGSYDVWLERISGDAGQPWSRVGPARSVVIDAQRPAVELELRPPA